MRSTLRKLAALTAAAILTILPATTGPAHAAATAYNLRTQWLTAAPTNSMPLSTVQREIRLAAYTYGWWTSVDPPAYGRCENHTGPILAGDYVWTDYLWAGNPAKGSYRHDSYLSEKTGGWAYKISCHFTLPLGDGNYTWGSGLDPHERPTE